MNINKANKRDKARNKKRNGMRVSGKTVFVIQGALIKRGKKKSNG